MSCGTSCGSCPSNEAAANGDGGEATKTILQPQSNQALIKRIREARASFSSTASPSPDTLSTWASLFNDLAMSLADYNAQAAKPLLAIYDQLGPRVFLDSCLAFLNISMRGLLLCWAFQYADEEPIKLMDLVIRRDEEMIQYVNRQAIFHECFPGNSPVGRINIPDYENNNGDNGRTNGKIIRMEDGEGDCGPGCCGSGACGPSAAGAGWKDGDGDGHVISDCGPSECGEEDCCRRGEKKNIQGMESVSDVNSLPPASNIPSSSSSSPSSSSSVSFSLLHGAVASFAVGVAVGLVVFFKGGRTAAIASK